VPAAQPTVGTHVFEPAYEIGLSIPGELMNSGASPQYAPKRLDERPFRSISQLLINSKSQSLINE
jgi:hypothetical protein